MKKTNKIKALIKSLAEKIDLKKFLKFGMTGLLNTAVDLAFYAFFCDVLNIDPKFAKVASVAAAAANSYIINKNWTFKKHGGKKSELPKFLAVNCAYLALNFLGVHIFVDRLGYNKYLALIPIMAITVPANYFGNKLFVFK